MHVLVDEGAQHITVNYMRLAVFEYVYIHACVYIFCVEYENARCVMYTYIVCMYNIMYMFAYSTCIYSTYFAHFLTRHKDIPCSQVSVYEAFAREVAHS